MVHNKALSSGEQNSTNSQPVKPVGHSRIKSSLGISLATAAICLLNSSSEQAISTTDLHPQTEAESAIAHESFVEKDPHSLHDWQDHSTGLLSRIFGLITAPFKDRLTTPSTVAEDRQQSQAMGGSAVRDLAPIYLSQARSASTKDFLAAKVQPMRSPKATPQTKLYTVKTGDTINRIAKKHQVSRNEIIKLNNIKNSHIIFVNQQLKIPLVASNNVTPNGSSTSGKENINLTSTNFPQSANSRTISPSSSTTYLADAKLKSKNLSQPNTEADNKDTISDDDRFNKLKAEIDLMRDRYRNQIRQERDSSKTSSKANTADLPSVSSTNNPEAQQSSFEQPSVKTDVMSSVLPKSDRDLDSISEEAISLQLPPLPPLEEHLPDTFEGYSWPAQGVLTSGYGWRWGRLHKGIDIAAPIGTPVVAAASGEVIKAGWNSGGYGNVVEIRHLDGSVTLYAHNNRIMVSHGQKVEQGEQIAEMGNTGYSTGSHLHFEIHSREKGIINPLALLNSK